MSVKLPKQKYSKKDDRGPTGDISFSPFEVVDMGDGKVGVNSGFIIQGFSSIHIKGEDFISPAKPQNLLGSGVSSSLFLDAVKNEYICIRIKENDSSRPQCELVSISGEKLADEENKRRKNKIIKLAKILDIEDGGEGESKGKYITIENLYNSNLMSELENWPPFTPIIWPEEEVAEGEDGEEPKQTWKAVFIPGAIYLPQTMTEPSVAKINGEPMSDFPIVDISEGQNWTASFDITTSWSLDGDLEFSAEPGSGSDISEVTPDPQGTCSFESCPAEAGSFSLSVLVVEANESGGLSVNQKWRSDICIYGYKICCPDIEITHPWKVTDVGGGIAEIAPGLVMGYYFQYSNAAPHEHPDPEGSYKPESIVLGPGGTYGGGQLSIAGTKYIYAEIPRNGDVGVTDEYAESMSIASGDLGISVGVELSDDIFPSISDSATVVADSSSADAYMPSTGSAAVCIARVVNDGANNLTISQYVTHNPTMFIPVVDVLAIESGSGSM